MICPTCGLHEIYGAGKIKVATDGLFGYNDYTLNAWKCKKCLNVFYTDAK